MRLRRMNPTECAKYAKQALKIANQYDLETEKIKAMQNFAFSNLISGDLDSAKVYTQESMMLAKEYQLQTYLAEGLHILGLAYQMEGNYPEALISYHDALIINEKLNREDEIVRQLNNMAIVRRELKDYKLALELLEKQRSIAERIMISSF